MSPQRPLKEIVNRAFLNSTTRWRPRDFGHGYIIYIIYGFALN